VELLRRSLFSDARPDVEGGDAQADAIGALGAESFALDDPVILETLDDPVILESQSQQTAEVRNQTK
jgi:hypothetical protein